MCIYFCTFAQLVSYGLDRSNSEGSSVISITRTAGRCEEGVTWAASAPFAFAFAYQTKGLRESIIGLGKVPVEIDG